MHPRVTTTPLNSSSRDFSPESYLYTHLHPSPSSSHQPSSSIAFSTKAYLAQMPLPLLPPPRNPPQALGSLTLPSSPAVSNWHPARRKRAAATKPLLAGKAASRAPSCQAHSSTILSSRPTATTRPGALKAKVRTEAPGAPSSYMGGVRNGTVRACSQHKPR